MVECETVVVRPSLPKLALNLLLGMGGVALGLLLVVGPGYILAVAVAVAAAVAVVMLVNAVARGRPAVELTADGFTCRFPVGGKSYRWSDIDGEFAVHNRLWLRMVVFRLTPEYKQRAARLPFAPCPGYDDAIGGAYQLPMTDLAALLNRYRGCGPSGDGPKGDPE